MKKLFYFVAVLALSAGFAACSDDDDDEKFASEISGTYTGLTTASFAYGSLVYADDEMVISENADGTVDVTYANLAEHLSSDWPLRSSVMGFGTFTDKGLKVAKVDGKYVMTGSGEVSIGMMGAPQAYAYTDTITVTPGAGTNSVSAKYTLPTLMMGGTTLTFVSNAYVAAAK